MPSLSRHFLLSNAASNLHFSLSRLTSTLTKFASLTPLTSTLTKTKDLKSFIINTYKKGGGGTIISQGFGAPGHRQHNERCPAQDIVALSSAA